MTPDSFLLTRRQLFRAAGVAGALTGVGALAGGLPAHGSPLPPGSHPFTPNQALLDAFMARRGGHIGTGGKVAVSFRCDHHLNKFASMLLPLHQRYSIPVTIAATSQMFRRERGPDGSDQLSFGRLQKLALENGLEIANHGATHQDAATGQQLREEIVYSRWALSKAMPRVPIELFIPPGVGGTNYLGFAGGTTQSAFQRYLAGRLIMQQHAVTTGYVPGYWPMTGNPLDSVGNVHIGLDNASYARRGPSFVAAARQERKGVSFMYHPSLIDAQDLEAIEELFAWCAAERDAGRLELLTTTGLMMSSFGSSLRHNILSSSSSFKNGWNGWNGPIAKWALLSESRIKFARRGSKSTAIFRDVHVGVHAGSPRQLRIPMRSTTGVRVRIEVLDADSAARLNIVKDLVVPKSNSFHTVQQYLILPLTGTSRVRVRITPRTGGELHLQEPQILAA